MDRTLIVNISVNIHELVSYDFPIQLFDNFCLSEKINLVDLVY